MNDYKFQFYVLFFVFMFTVGFSSVVLYDINKTLHNMQAIMQDDQISKYIDAGWMPPLEYAKTKTRTPKQEKN